MGMGPPGHGCAVCGSVVFRKVGCCDGIPAGEMAGKEPLRWPSMGWQPCCGVVTPLGAQEAPCPARSSWYVNCDDELACVLIAGCDVVVGTDDVR